MIRARHILSEIVDIFFIIHQPAEKDRGARKYIDGAPLSCILTIPKTVI